MRIRPHLLAPLAALVSISCTTTSTTVTPDAKATAPAAESAPLAADTKSATAQGATFIAPKGWTLTQRGPATTIEAPEKDSRIVLVDVQAKDADAAVAAAWAASGLKLAWPLKLSQAAADRDGWTDRKGYQYETSPNEKRGVGAMAQRHGDTWTVAIEDLADATAEKRGGQLGLIFGALLPKGKQRETFAGKKANTLDAARIAALSEFVEKGRKLTTTPGIGIGIIQGGKVVFAGGFGEKQLGKPEKIDGDTLFMIASNTKALTTLLLATLVDEKKLDWNAPVVQQWPTFKLGDADTTSRVLVKHLVCACTGMPRQDTEWWFEFKDATPASSMALLGTMQPTSKFGELYQYSNLMAGAAGYLGGHLVHPQLELGLAYDLAMEQRVFKPLGMNATTFDFARALASNHATPHSLDLDDHPAIALMEPNYSVLPLRPAGAAWSSVNDLLKYVAMELAKGTLPGGKRFIGEAALLARREPQVALGSDASYAMALMIDNTWGIPVIHHGGDMVGFHSDMIWLPEQDVGAVILTNSDPGVLVRGPFRRKLLEVLFDGEPIADAQMAKAAEQFHDEIKVERARWTLPAAEADAALLAPRYKSTALGELKILRQQGKTLVDIGEWKSELASRHNQDGTVSFTTTTPGVQGSEFVVGSPGAKRTLITRDAQHEYVFTEQ
jgi:CubicO group peptidase (beta-lactamase class C family)